MKIVKNLSLLFLVLLCFCCRSVKVNDSINGKFEVQDMNSICFRTGIRDNGVQCLRIWAEHTTREKALALGKKYAVASVLMRGVAGTQSSVKEPLLSLADQQKNAVWIENFFNSGEYLKYLDQAEVEPNELYIVRGGYRLGVNAKVAYERLNTRLFEEGIKVKHTF